MLGTVTAYMQSKGPAAAGELQKALAVKDDKELVTALVNSDAFKFRQCRLAFNYLYGRDENLCEGPIFDTCMQAYGTKGTIESALGAVAQNKAFCE